MQHTSFVSISGSCVSFSEESANCSLPVSPPLPSVLPFLSELASCGDFQYCIFRLKENKKGKNYFSINIDCLEMVLADFQMNPVICAMLSVTLKFHL